MDPNTSLRENDAFVARIKGAVKRFEDKGEITRIGFLDQTQIDLAEKYFRDTGFLQFSFHFSRDDCIRKFLSVGTYYDEELPLVYLKFRPDKFHSLAHRDYMGALMAQGIDRKLFGDLLVNESSTAYLVVWDKGDIVRYLLENFSSSGRARVYIEEASQKDFDRLEMQYETVEIIVSSLRADCVTASLAKLSRTQAKEYILKGDFKLYSVSVFDSDRLLSCGDVFSLRGIGKFRFEKIVGQTRRERIRIKLLKFGNYIERNLS